MQGKNSSLESQNILKEKGELIITSFLPVDNHDCDCLGLVNEWNERLAKLPKNLRDDTKAKYGQIDCPRAEGKKKYKITCANCGALIGFVHADNEKLDGWCNFHYTTELKEVEFIEYKKVKVKTKKGFDIVTKKVKTKKPQWIGCFTPNISPTDGKLGFECTCGQDTRDCRSMISANPKMAEISKQRLEGREFGQINSKFITEEIK